jgi:hypothetical protein
MKREIVIDNSFFPFNEGCKLLKRKYQICPKDIGIEDFWDEIEPISINDILQMQNIENRRICFKYIPQQEFLNTLEPELISSVTLDKVTNWVELDVQVKYQDTYELYRVAGDKLIANLKDSFRTILDCHFVKFKDTSTEREYMIWVDLTAIKQQSPYDYVDAISAIAWTIQTNLPVGQISSFIRQGDCIIFKPKESWDGQTIPTRHITRNEYLNLLIAES